MQHITDKLSGQNSQKLRHDDDFGPQGKLFCPENKVNTVKHNKGCPASSYMDNFSGLGSLFMRKMPSSAAFNLQTT